MFAVLSHSPFAQQTMTNDHENGRGVTRWARLFALILTLAPSSKISVTSICSGVWSDKKPLLNERMLLSRRLYFVTSSQTSPIRDICMYLCHPMGLSTVAVCRQSSSQCVERIENMEIVFRCTAFHLDSPSRRHM